MKSLIKNLLTVAVLSTLLAGQDREQQRQECIRAMSGYDPDATTNLDVPRHLSTIRIEYSESGCYGNCPAFSMELSETKIVFDGRAYVRAKGKKSAPLNPEEFAKIVKAWYDGRFYAMREDYCSPKCPDGSVTIITDVPGYSVSYRDSELHKDVYYCSAYLNGKPETPEPPIAFRDFQRLMRELARSHKWL